MEKYCRPISVQPRGSSRYGRRNVTALKTGVWNFPRSPKPMCRCELSSRMIDVRSWRSRRCPDQPARQRIPSAKSMCICEAASRCFHYTRFPALDKPVGPQNRCAVVAFLRTSIHTDFAGSIPALHIGFGEALSERCGPQYWYLSMAPKVVCLLWEHNATASNPAVQTKYHKGSNSLWSFLSNRCSLTFLFWEHLS